MHLRPFVALGLLLALASCHPQYTGTDLDEDGILDQYDQCMADPEDMDGFEDEDGCPEKGEAPEGPRGPDDASGNVETPVPPPPTAKGIKQVKSPRFAESTAKAKLNLAKKQVWGAIASSSGQTLLFGFTKAYLQTGKKEKPLPFAVSYATFSMDGSRVGIVHNKGIALVDSTNGKRLAALSFAKGASATPIGKAIAFRGNALVAFDGCHLWQLAPKKTQLSKASRCGDATGDKDLSHVYIHQEGERSARELNDKFPAVALGEDGALKVAAVSPEGRFFCFSRTVEGKDLVCRENQSGAEYQVFRDSRQLEISFATDRVLIASEVKEDKRWVYLVDLGAKTMRTIARGSSRHHMRKIDESSFSLAGPTEVQVVNFVSKNTTLVPLPKGEWDGLRALDSKRFVMGRERKATRDLYLLEIE